MIEGIDKSKAIHHHHQKSERFDTGIFNKGTKIETHTVYIYGNSPSYYLRAS